MLRHFKTRHFFSKREKEQIIAAIEAAEKRTSGEIRVHVEARSGNDPIERAKEVFATLGMTKTALRNGVLIYLAVEDRKFAIIGDEGIDRVAPANFWEEIKEKMSALFQEGRFADGVCLGIKLAGEHLAAHFPYQDNDVNELNNEISEGT